MLGRTLEYGTAGRIRHQFTEPIPIEFSRMWNYDALGRVAVDTTGSIGTDECTYDPYQGWVCPSFVADSTVSFVYDPVGNVLRDSVYRVWNGTTNVQTGSYGLGHRISGFGRCTYGTDLDGNVTSRTCGSEAVTLWWSSENRLDSLSTNGVKTRFFYDGFGRLVKRDANGTIHYFWWDGNNLFAEFDASGAKLVEYSYYGMDVPHALATADSTVYFMQRDGLGNVIGLVDDTGAVIERYGGEVTYSLWGAGWTSGRLPGGGQNRALFKGALWMGDVGPDLYYMRARWYEPRTGRFLSEDPAGLMGGINSFVFGGNDGVNTADPTGLDLCVMWGLDGTCIPASGGITLPAITVWGSADAEARALDMIAASGPYSGVFAAFWAAGSSQGERSGGGGSGAMPASRPANGGKSWDWQKCLSAVGGLGLTVLADATFVGTLRVLRGALRIVRLAERYVTRYGEAQNLVAMYNAFRDLRAQRLVAGAATGSLLGQLGTRAQGNALRGVGTAAWEFAAYVPIAASMRASIIAGRDCLHESSLA